MRSTYISPTPFHTYLSTAAWKGNNKSLSNSSNSSDEFTTQALSKQLFYLLRERDREQGNTSRASSPILPSWNGPQNRVVHPLSSLSLSNVCKWIRKPDTLCYKNHSYLGNTLRIRLYLHTPGKLCTRHDRVYVHRLCIHSDNCSFTNPALTVHLWWSRYVLRRSVDPYLRFVVKGNEFLKKMWIRSIGFVF